MNDQSQGLDNTNWETRYLSGDTPWDKGGAAPPLLEFLTRFQIWGDVLVPGSGPGHDVRSLAAQGATVTGLDISGTVIQQARSLPRVAGEIHQQGDLFHLPESYHDRFDWVVEHTCFCAIDPALRADYVRAIARALKPGGHYFAILFMTPDAEQGPPFGATKEEISHLFDAEFDLLEEWVPMQTFDGREGRELCQLRRKGDRLKTEDF